MHKSRRQFDTRCSASSAFTLVEALVALALSALVLALVGKLAVGSLRSRSAAQDAFETMRRNTFWWDRVRDDVDHLIQVTDNEMTPIAVYGAPQQTLRLLVLAAIPDRDDTLHVARRPAMVYYRLRPSSTAGYELIREQLDMTRADAVLRRETIAIGLRRVAVAILHGEKWAVRYPPVSAEPREVRAIRITCDWMGQEESFERTIAVREGV